MFQKLLKEQEEEFDSYYSENMESVKKSQRIVKNFLHKKQFVFT